MMTQLTSTMKQPLLTNTLAVDWFHTLTHKCHVICSVLTMLLLLGFSLSAQAATTTLTSSVTTVVVGVNVTLTASVAGVSPTGTVTFKDGTTTIGTANTTGTAATRTAVLVTNFSTVGTHSITAVYAGDANDTGSTSAVRTVTATIKATTNTVTASPTSAAVGANVALTATVVGYTPTGTVTFKDGTVTIGTSTLTGTGTTATATLNTTFSTVASHSITAVYAGDANDATRTSTARAVTVTKAATTTTLTTSVTTAAVGQSVTLTATVVGFSPSGNVAFKDGTTTIATVATTGTGTSRTATFNATFSTAGSHSITAVYATNTTDNTSTSAAKVVTVTTTAATTTTLTTNLATATVGQSVTLTATTTGLTPTGNVVFKDGATTIGTVATTGSGTSRTATLNTSFTTTGAHNLTAVYAGDTDDATSTSAASNISITAPNLPPTISITAPANNATYTAPASVTITANAADTDGTINQVAFYNGATLINTDTTAPYSYDLTGLAVGSYALTAVATDNSNATTTSSAINIAVTTTATTTALTVSPNPALVNQTVTATATVAGNSPTGSITWKDGTTTLGTTPLVSGVATASTSFTVTGAHSITAEYGGDANNAASTSAASNLIVNAPNVAPTVSITAPANNASFTAPANIALTATATDSDGTISQVQFYDGATLLGTTTQQGTTSTYTYNWNNVAQGSYTNITAKATDNSGNTTTNSTTSAPIQLTITQGVAQVYYIHTDHLNTPRLITNAANSKVWEWNNDDPFANNVPNDDPNNTGNRFTYNPRLPGQYFDQETNTHYNYYRDYDPQTGRYIESDPIGLEGGINTYGYVGGNPLMYADPMGLAAGGKPLSTDPLKTLNDTHNEMENKNVSGTDNFFHCLATCRAKKNGSDPDTIKFYTDMKENRDYLYNLGGQYGKGELSNAQMIEDMNLDKAANKKGLSCPDDISCEKQCIPLLNGLPDRRKPFMKEYYDKAK